MQRKGFINLFVVILLLIVFVAVAAIAYFFGSGKLQWNGGKQIPSPTPTLIAGTPTPIPTPTAKPGWKVYKSERYGFEISYPNTYQALDDKDNLYGWPKAVVLLYNGGQAYDIAIEAWNSQSEYQSKYPSQANLTVSKIGDKYITILDSTQEEGNSEIIATFKALD